MLIGNARCSWGINYPTGNPSDHPVDCPLDLAARNLHFLEAA
jgi:hypothetical protein